MSAQTLQVAPGPAVSSAGRLRCYSCLVTTPAMASACVKETVLYRTVFSRTVRSVHGAIRVDDLTRV